MVGRGWSAGWEQLGAVRVGADVLLELAVRGLEEVRGSLVVLQGLVVNRWLVDPGVQELVALLG